MTPVDPLAGLTITEGVMARVNPDDLVAAVDRFTRRDWGTVDAEDARANDAAADTGGYLLAAYADRNGVRFWIERAPGAPVPTVTLPEER